jgi:hypothetical protein
MPDMIPVGNTGVTPNPLGSISQMIAARSGMIGLQQQQVGLQQAQQNLQTGQYTQQTAQAGAQVAQQQVGQLQALAQFTKNAINDPKYQRADGSLDVEKFSRDASVVAPTQQDKISEAISNATAAITNKRALASLTSDQNKLAGGYWASVAGNPNAQESDIANAARMTRAIDPKNQLLQDSVDNALLHFGKAQTPAQRQQIASGVSSLLSGGSPLASGTNAAAQNQVVNTLTGARTMPELGQGATNPTTAEVSGAAARQIGTANSDIDRANQVSANVKSAPATIQTSQQIDDLAEQIHSGKFADAISKAAAAVGVQTDTYARQLLKKDLGIIQTQLTAAAPSDSRAATILSGTPDATSDTQTIHGAMDYVRGAARQNLAQGQNKNAYQSKHPDLSGFQQADDTFTGAAGPLVHEFLSLKNPSDLSSFYRRNFSSPQQALQFRNQAYAAEHTLGLGQ